MNDPEFYEELPLEDQRALLRASEMCAAWCIRRNRRWPKSETEMTAGAIPTTLEIYARYVSLLNFGGLEFDCVEDGMFCIKRNLDGGVGIYVKLTTVDDPLVPKEIQAAKKELIEGSLSLDVC